jgi:hypothetical protein
MVPGGGSAENPSKAWLVSEGSAHCPCVRTLNMPLPLRPKQCYYHWSGFMERGFAQLSLVFGRGRSREELFSRTNENLSGRPGLSVTILTRVAV